MHKHISIALLLSCIPVVAHAQPSPVISTEVILADKTGDIELRRIQYRSDGLVVNGYFAIPKTGTKLPCIIMNRGGNDTLGTWTDEAAARTLVKQASWGYAVVASQYRGANGAEGKDEYGGADVDDVLNLIPVLEAEPRADASRIGMIGVSRGGTMAYIALTKTTRIAAAVINSGIADLLAWRAERPEMDRVFTRMVPDYATARDAQLIARSAIRWPQRLNKSTPILILHGTADWRANPKSNAINMATALYEAKHPFRMVLFEGAQHGLLEHKEEADRITREWLDRYVRDRKPWPSLEPHGD
jgi:dipeptidyl aminopeptidase/acylaminoacyl peptidase